MRLKTLFHFKAKVIEPCSKLLSIFKHKCEKTSMSTRIPTFRMPIRRSKPKIRTKTVRFRKPFSIKAFNFRRCRPRNKVRLRKIRPSFSSKFKKAFRQKKHIKTPRKPVQKVRIGEYLTVLFSLRKAKEIDNDSCDQVMGDVRSVSPSSGGHANEPFPSPITPGYVRISYDSKKESSDNLRDVEDDSDNVEDACKYFENYLVEMIVEERKVKDLMDVEDLLYCWRNLKSPVFIDLVCRFYGESCKDLFSSSEETENLETSSSE